MTKSTAFPLFLAYKVDAYAPGFLSRPSAYLLSATTFRGYRPRDDSPTHEATKYRRTSDDLLLLRSSG